jgi:coenzyme F420-0:L-glutamate ligase/coenzyme F420-1:gamma-L-glutamate ligase
VSLLIEAVPGVPEVHAGDDLVALFLTALKQNNMDLQPFDLVSVTSKVVAKAEGRVVPCEDTDEAKHRLIDQESVRTIRRRGPLRITETTHGFVCANAGIDLSNTDAGTAVLLPVDPDRSARRFRADIRRALGIDVAVIVTDTFGRAWRHGVADIALGVAGLKPVLDLRGTEDGNGRVLQATEVAIVDEVASAVDLVLGKASRTPFARVRGLDPSYFGEGSIREHVIRRPNDDLFR